MMVNVDNLEDILPFPHSLIEAKNILIKSAS